MLHAHLLKPLSAEITRRLEHEGQNKVAIPAPEREIKVKVKGPATSCRGYPLLSLCVD